MKATFKDSSNGILFGYTKIDHKVTSTMLECMVHDMMEYNKNMDVLADQRKTNNTLSKFNIEHIKITRDSVENKVRDSLYDRGRVWFEYGFWDEYKEVSESASKLTRQLFPDFYTK